MSDTLTDSVARLHRAGSEHSKSTEKLRKAANDLLLWIKANIPQGIAANLPLNCSFYPSGEFVQTELSNPPHGSHIPKFTITLGKEHTRDQLFHFSRLIAGGFLDKLSEQLQTEAGSFDDATAAIDMLLNPKGNPSPIYIGVVGDKGNKSAILPQGIRDIGGAFPECLETLIKSFVQGTVYPKATPELIDTMKKYAGGGIVICNGGTTCVLEVIVRTTGGTPFFMLHPKKPADSRAISEM